MSKNKRPQIPKKSEVSLVRSSAAEYPTLLAATGNAQSSLEMRCEAIVKPHLMVQTEGERDVQRKVDHHSLQAKNDLIEHEMEQLQRRVLAYLVVAQDR